MTKKVSGNWGNWGEFWVFLKALEDGHFALSDMALNPIKGKYLTIKKVYRENLIFDVTDVNTVSFVAKNGKKIEIKKDDIKCFEISIV